MLHVKNVSFGYKKSRVLKNITFEVSKGNHFSIIGESGSGKSTLLKLLYGTYDLLEGDIFWNDTRILGPKFNLIVGPSFMKYVAQEFDLMPFTTVAENVGEFLSNFFPEEKKARIAELLKVVELEAFSNTKVKELSGGQKQRVALARAIAKEPEILLLDEPFSHIDNFKKQSLRRNFFKYLKEKNITTIVATHDKNDVLGFSDHMLVLHDKKIIAQDTPQTLYKNPKTPLIASFFDEFNTINSHGIKYAHQLKIVEKSDLKGSVKTSYFNGNSWLIEVNYNDSSVFIKHHTKLTENTSVFFKIAT
jgi:ABC-type Fe3+/spermidine/putrescine transport system ATPase subunit